MAILTHSIAQPYFPSRPSLPTGSPTHLPASLSLNWISRPLWPPYHSPVPPLPLPQHPLPINFSPTDVCHRSVLQGGTSKQQIAQQGLQQLNSLPRLSTIPAAYFITALYVTVTNLVGNMEEIQPQGQTRKQKHQWQNIPGLFLCSSNFQSSCPLKCIDGADQDSQRLSALL